MGLQYQLSTSCFNVLRYTRVTLQGLYSFFLILTSYYVYSVVICYCLLTFKEGTYSAILLSQNLHKFFSKLFLHC